MELTNIELLAKVSTCLGLFPSVIQSGEKWSEQCETVRREGAEALRELYARASNAPEQAGSDGMLGDIIKAARPELDLSGPTEACAVGEITPALAADRESLAKWFREDIRYKLDEVVAREAATNLLTSGIVTPWPTREEMAKALCTADGRVVNSSTSIPGSNQPAWPTWTEYYKGADAILALRARASLPHEGMDR